MPPEHTTNDQNTDTDTTAARINTLDTPRYAARYPWTRDAQHHLANTDLTITDLLDHDPTRRRALDRIQTAIHDTRIGDPADNHTVELLSYPLARAIAATAGDHIHNRLAAAEARTATTRRRDDQDRAADAADLAILDPPDHPDPSDILAAAAARLTATDTTTDADALNPDTLHDHVTDNPDTDTDAAYTLPVTAYLHLVGDAAADTDTALHLARRDLRSGTVHIHADHADHLLEHCLTRALRAARPGTPSVDGGVLDDAVQRVAEMVADVAYPGVPSDADALAGAVGTDTPAPSRFVYGDAAPRGVRAAARAIRDRAGAGDAGDAGDAAVCETRPAAVFVVAAHAAAVGVPCEVLVAGLGVTGTRDARYIRAFYDAACRHPDAGDAAADDGAGVGDTGGDGGDGGDGGEEHIDDGVSDRSESESESESGSARVTPEYHAPTAAAARRIAQRLPSVTLDDTGAGSDTGGEGVSMPTPAVTVERAARTTDTPGGEARSDDATPGGSGGEVAENTAENRGGAGGGARRAAFGFQYPCPACGTTSNLHSDACRFGDLDRADIEVAYIDVLARILEDGARGDALRRATPSEWPRGGVHRAALGKLLAAGRVEDHAADAQRGDDGGEGGGEGERRGARVVVDQDADAAVGEYALVRADDLTSGGLTWPPAGLDHPVSTVYEHGSVPGCHDNAVFCMVAYAETCGLSWSDATDRVAAWLRESGAWERGGFEESSPAEVVRKKRHVHREGYGWDEKAEAAARVIEDRLGV